MPNFTADLIIEARWIVPMTQPDILLENHAIAVGNGRILELLPQAQAKSRYAQTPSVQRPNHLMLPGLVNAHTRTGMSLLRGLPGPLAALEQRFVSADFVGDAVLLSIAEMLLAGVTCFSDAYLFPNETAKAAAEQGIRACVGLPVCDVPTSWARSAGEYISKALSVRDEYKGHPMVTTRFAPRAVHTIGDETLIQVRTLADELDAGISVSLHASTDSVRTAHERFGVRPLERMDRLGLLTPALNAVHMAQVTAAEIDLARRSGISVTLCPEADLRRGHGAPPVAAWVKSGTTLSLGSGAAAAGADHDVWSEARLAALLSRPQADHPPSLAPWDALELATRGGAAALGLGDQIGTLATGKWADICCVDLDHPALQPSSDPAALLLFCGGRDRVCDVWIAGRHLVSESRLTRLDWPAVSGRAQAWAQRLKC